MARPYGNLIRASRVRLAGRRRIGPPQPAGGDAFAGVRLVGQDADGATLEVACPCGRKTYVRCAYAAPAAQPPEPTTDSKS